jgi:hypothetical protein
MLNTTLEDGTTIEIYKDNYPSNPREWDNLCTMVCFHSRHNLGDEHDYNHQDYRNWEELKSAIIKDNDVAIILPLYLYDHSGITISTEPFSCPWDSGQIGFIYVSKEKIREEFSVKRITKKLKDRIEFYNVLGEVDTYDKYIMGEVYGFNIEYADGDSDSCSGFFGSDIKENGILDNIPRAYHTEILNAI